MKSILQPLYPYVDLNKKESLDRVPMAYGSAAPLDAMTQSRFQELPPRGGPFTQVMGMIEISCFASVLPYPEDNDTGSGGRFAPNLVVKLLDDDSI